MFRDEERFAGITEMASVRREGGLISDVMKIKFLDQKFDQLF